MMKRASKASNVHGEFYLKQNQRLTIAYTGNRLPDKKQSRKGTGDCIVYKITYH